MLIFRGRGVIIILKSIARVLGFAVSGGLRTSTKPHSLLLFF